MDDKECRYVPGSARWTVSAMTPQSSEKKRKVPLRPMPCRRGRQTEGHVSRDGVCMMGWITSDVNESGDDEEDNCHA